MAEQHPKFLREYDLIGNYHAVREIVLGGSESWAGVWKRFSPGPATLVADIGANAGIFAAACASKKARVVAVEPYAVAFEMLLQLEKMVGISPRHQAIADRNGTCEYRGNISWLLGPPTLNGGIEGCGVRFSDTDHALAEIVECITLENLIENLQWDCVKMDIEGAEAAVILAAPEATLHQIKFMYIEFHPWVPQALYDEMVCKLSANFNFEGASAPTPTGRWEAAYCTRRAM
jgi:FkbM family methyltransferase